MSEKPDAIFDKLGQIRSAETPPYLLTRIQQSIQNQSVAYNWSLTRSWSIAAVFLCLMMFNFWIIFKEFNKELPSKESAELYTVFNDNNIYR